MQLTLHADYSLRVLLYLAERPDHVASTQDISDAYGISRHHLVRVVQTLAAAKFVHVTTGRKGGVTLAQEPAAISIGQVVRSAEPSFRIVECFDRETNQCPLEPVCKLRGMLREALGAFLAVLDGYTLADVTRMPKARRLSLFFLTDANSTRQLQKQPL